MGDAGVMKEPVGTYVYRVVDGTELAADVYLPDDRRTVKPVVLWLHGGALIRGSRKGIRVAQMESYLSDYVVVSIDYRLAPETKLPETWTDIEAAYAWIRQCGPDLWNIDPNRAVIAGASAGGYLSLLAGCRLTPRPTAIVSWYGYGDITAPWYAQPSPFYRTRSLVSREDALEVVGESPIAFDDGATDRGRFYLYCRQQGRWPIEVVGAHPATQKERLVPWCPALNVDDRYPPTLLIHGDDDTDVPHEQSRQMSDSLARSGIPHELLIVHGGSHGFDSQHDDPQTKTALEKSAHFIHHFVDRAAPR
jgi:acetyl esterase/lipase